MLERLIKVDPLRGLMPLRAVQKPSDERVLHVHLDTDLEPQMSMRDALKALGDQYTMLPWPRMPHGHLQHWILEQAGLMQPTLVWMQLQTPGVVDVVTLKMLRGRMDPRGKIVVWCGDIGRDQTWELEFSKHVDLMLYSSMTVVRRQRELGMQNAAYLQIGYDEEYHYPRTPAFETVNTRVFDETWLHDVVFAGQNYDEKRWQEHCPEHEIQLRRDVVNAFTQQDESWACDGRFGLYGQRWEAARFPAQRVTTPREMADIYRRSKIGVSISLTSKHERYSSDRLHRILACGALALVKSFDDMESWGLKDAVNCIEFDTPEQAVDAVHAMLEPPNVKHLPAIRERGAKLVKEHHTWGVRMLEQAVYLAVLRGESIRVVQP